MILSYGPCPILFARMHASLHPVLSVLALASVSHRSSSFRTRRWTPRAMASRAQDGKSTGSVTLVGV